MDIQKFPERRKSKRFKLKDPAFAIMYCSPTRTGQIIDISRTGLAIRYNKIVEGPIECTELDIFKSDFGFYIDSIKAKTISDTEIIDKIDVGPKELRRCGIQFADLDNNQISQLEDFIQNFALSEGLNQDI